VTRRARAPFSGTGARVRTAYASGGARPANGEFRPKVQRRRPRPR